jgi:acetyl esterase/lipase
MEKIMTDRSRLDPETTIPLDGLLEALPGGFNAIPDINARRATLSGMIAAMEVPVNPNVEVTEHIAPGPAGDIKVRVFSPKNVASPRPALVFIHGGGMILGSIDDEHDMAQLMCDQLGMTIASVDYRKAPENPHPAATNDCFAASQWVFANAKSLGIDANKIGIYGGSAGGGLAISVALKARDEKGPDFKFMVPIYPMIDHRNESHSSKLITDVGIWDREGSIEAWTWYLGGQEPDQYSSPAIAASLKGLPPAYIDVGEMDMFRDENLDFVKRLGEADVRVEFHLWPGVYHGAEVFAPDATISQTIMATRLAGIKRLVELISR